MSSSPLIRQIRQKFSNMEVGESSNPRIMYFSLCGLPLVSNLLQVISHFIFYFSIILGYTTIDKLPNKKIATTSGVCPFVSRIPYILQDIQLDEVVYGGSNRGYPSVCPLTLLTIFFLKI